MKIDIDNAIQELLRNGKVARLRIVDRKVYFAIDNFVGIGDTFEDALEYYAAVVGRASISSRPLSGQIMPFKVRTGCGHVVIRKMREATAGKKWTPETIIEAPNGALCKDCEGAKP